VGDGGTILPTTDGGANWDIQASGITSDLESVFAFNANIAWAVGEFGIILYTSNGGTTWTTQESGTSWYLNSIHFVNDVIGGAVGFMGAIVHTNSGGLTGVNEIIDPVGARLELYPNYPNPFHSSTTICINIPASFTMKNETSLKVYDNSGRIVHNLHEGYLSPGLHEFQWFGTCSEGKIMTPEIYMIRLQAGTTIKTRKMILHR